MDHRRAFELGKQVGVWASVAHALILLSLIELKPLPWYVRAALFMLAMYALSRWSKADDLYADESYRSADEP
nr:MAG: hypothetical protein DIU57_14285 [Pseudomonadota bacterium]